MNNKRMIATLILSVFFFMNGYSQNMQGKADDFGRIILNTYVSDQEALPKGAKKMLSNILTRITTQNGVGGSVCNPRFIITPNITILSKDITATAPSMTVLDLEVTLYIGDGIDGTKFASKAFEVKGLGTNETKAYITAFKKLKPRSPGVKHLIEEGKRKIVEYYNSKCDFILQDAKSKAGRKEYDKAILTLLSVPEVCKESYDRCMDEAVKVYKLKVDNEGNKKIQAARIAMSNKDWKKASELLNGILPDASCYKEAKSILNKISENKYANALAKAKGAWAVLDSGKAAYWLGQISSNAKCYNEALALGEEIKNKMKDDEKHEWETKLNKYKLELAKAKAGNQAGLQYSATNSGSKSNGNNSMINSIRAFGAKCGSLFSKDVKYDIANWL